MTNEEELYLQACNLSKNWQRLDNVLELIDDRIKKQNRRQSSMVPKKHLGTAVMVGLTICPQPKLPSTSPLSWDTPMKVPCTCRLGAAGVITGNTRKPNFRPEGG